MVTVTVALCLHCGDALYSRARHDCRTCTCGHTMIDGGQDYVRLGYTGLPPVQFQYTLEDTVASLERDWATREDRYGHPANHHRLWWSPLRLALLAQLATMAPCTLHTLILEASRRNPLVKDTSYWRSCVAIEDMVDRGFIVRRINDLMIAPAWPTIP